MANFVTFFCASLLVFLASSAAAARPVAQTHFLVQGRVFCDTCQAGFETPLITYVAGAKVNVECREKLSDVILYSAEGVTDATGTYKILVANEHAEQLCESVLVSSPDAGCAKFVPGRDRATVVLTHNNGVVSDTRLANNMGFEKESVSDGCGEVMKMYQLTDEDV